MSCTWIIVSIKGAPSRCSTIACVSQRKRITYYIESINYSTTKKIKNFWNLCITWRVRSIKRIAYYFSIITLNDCYQVLCGSSNCSHKPIKTIVRNDISAWACCEVKATTWWPIAFIVKFLYTLQSNCIWRVQSEVTSWNLKYVSTQSSIWIPWNLTRFKRIITTCCTLKTNKRTIETLNNSIYKYYPKAWSVWEFKISQLYIRVCDC